MSSKTVFTLTLNVLAAAVAFLCTSLVIRWTLNKLQDPLSLYAELRSEKLAMADSNKSFTAAAFGSSHVHDGFDPRAFEAGFSDALPDLKAFNFGVEGGSQTEQRKLATRFVQNAKAHGNPGALVILELNAGVNLQSRHLIDPRTINIYDIETAGFAATFSSPELSFKQRVGRAGFAILGGTLHYLNVGMVSNYIFRPPLKSEVVESQMESDKRGLHALPLKQPKAIEQASPETIEARIGSAIQIQPGNVQLIEDISRACPSFPIRFVYIVMPTYKTLKSKTAYPVKVETSAGEVPIIDMTTMPELRQASLWHDRGHLNEAGAAVLTRNFGEKLAQHYRKTP